MALGREHEIHKRRFGRNLGVGLALLAFAGVIFGLTLAKVGGPPDQGFDHVLRPEMLEEAEP